MHAHILTHSYTLNVVYPHEDTQKRHLYEHPRILSDALEVAVTVRVYGGGAGAGAGGRGAATVGGGLGWGGLFNLADYFNIRHSSEPCGKSRWPSWAGRPNEPSGFRGRKAILNHASALVSACP